MFDVQKKSFIMMNITKQKYQKRLLIDTIERNIIKIVTK